MSSLDKHLLNLYIPLTMLAPCRPEQVRFRGQAF